MLNVATYNSRRADDEISSRNKLPLEGPIDSKEALERKFPLSGIVHVCICILSGFIKLKLQESPGRPTVGRVWRATHNNVRRESATFLAYAGLFNYSLWHVVAVDRKRIEK